MTQPAWSPDGSVLAVEHADAGGTSVYTIRPDGSHPQLVLRNASSPSWSADGKRLFVVRNGDDSAVLMTVQLDGGDAREVDLENEDAYSDPAEPAFPSDGTWIGFYADDGPSPDFDSSAAAWSPDAKHLAFVSDSNPALWVVAADGGRPQSPRDRHLRPAVVGGVPAGASAERLSLYGEVGRTIRSALITPALPARAGAVTVASSVQMLTRSPRFALMSAAVCPPAPRSTSHSQGP